MSSLLLKSFAKINLYLKILGLRQDGFHDIESLFQTVSLFDELAISEIPGGIEVLCDDPSIPKNEKNICYQAVDAIRKDRGMKTGVKIEIKKKIPSGAGLGGGSSDAAAVLVGLNKLWDLKYSEEKLIELAAQVGSDVPFFIIGGRAVCKGRGENIEKGAGCRTSASSVEPVQGAGRQKYVIVKPDVSVATKWAYAEWDKLRGTGYRGTGENGNDLESIVIKKFPIIGQIKKDLIEAGCSHAMMTGSGSAVFGVIDDNEKANDIFDAITGKHLHSFLVEETDKGVEIVS